MINITLSLVKEMARVFLSHVASDYELAVYLKELLQNYVPSLEVFVSSDPTDLPPGVKWSAEIQRALEKSELLLLLATSRSLHRPWVWFECGTFWFSNRKIIPLCIGQVKKIKLPPPLSERMALNLEDIRDVEELFRAVGRLNATSPITLNIPLIVEQLKKLEEGIAKRLLKEIVGWIGVQWNNRFLSYEGPIEGLALIEDDVFQESMADALKFAGFRVRLGSPDRLSAHAEKGYRIIYLTDQKSWRRKITRGDVVLIARPEGLCTK